MRPFITPHRVLLIWSIFCVVSWVTPLAQAATSDPSFGVANYLPITDKHAKDGSIISLKGDKYLTSTQSYDPTVVGIVTENPAVVFQNEADKKYPVMSTGNVYVLVSTANGKIKKGDMIATSTIPGVGVKADKAGFVIGTALESYTASSAKVIGKILVALNVHYNYKESGAARGFLDILHLSTVATFEQPVVVLKYSLGGIILIIAFIIAFASFAKASQRGIEAIGRNPLAGRMIQFSIFLNVLISIAIVLAGFGLAYLVIKL